MNETLEAMARAIFKSWFVDFDPVRAKMEGRQPAGIDAATATLFPNSFEASPVGLIPYEWRVGKLSDIADMLMGTYPHVCTYNDEGLGKPLINDPVEFGDYFPFKKKWTTAPDRLSAVGDIIFCVRGSTTGRRVIADDIYCLGRGVCSIRSRKQHHAFLYQSVNFNLERLLSRITGSVFPNLNGPDLKNFQVIIPPAHVIDAFQRIAAPLFDRFRLNAKEADTIGALRDALLPRLLSGEIRTTALCEGREERA